MESLGAYKKNGVVWASSRIRNKQLTNRLRQRDLPVIMSTEPLAQSVFLKTYRDDHEQNPKEVAGRARQLTRIQEQDIAPEEVAEKRAKIVQKWKKKWVNQESQGRVARKNWKQSERNSQVEGRGRKKNEIEHSMPGWRMARIQEVKVDEDGRARSINFAFHTRKVTDKERGHISKTTKTIEVGIQRLAVLLVKDERGAPVQGEEK